MSNSKGKNFMSALKTMTVVGALSFVLAAGQALAQTPPPAQPPQNPPAQPPAKPPVGQPPAGQPPVPATPQPPRPFPEGAKIAYVDLQRIAQASAEGKAAAAKLEELKKQKTAELTEKSKSLEGMRTKLQQGGTVLSDQARGQLEKDIDKTTREIQFLQQSAQAEFEQLESELNQEFQRKLNPILDQVSKEKGLHMLFSIRDNGAVWADTGLDLSDEIVKRFDAVAKTPAKK
jgi:Skp family chaperone for outer membrane proteins